MNDRVKNIYEELKAIEHVLEVVEKAQQMSDEKRYDSILLNKIDVDMLVTFVEAYQSYLKGRLVI